MIAVGFLVFEIGLVLLVLVLLNARDRRRDRATSAAVGACPLPLLSLIAVSARAPLWRRRVVVTIDMTACDDAQVWSTVRQVAAALPPRAGLVVRTRVAPARPAAIGVRPSRLAAEISR